MAGDGARLRLTVPPLAEEISTMRSFAFAVGRHEGLGEETTEDLKLALSEIAADGIEAGGSSIAISVRTGEGALDVTVEVPGAVGPADADAGGEPALDRAQIVRALFPTAGVRRADGSIVTTFSVDRG